MGIHAIMPIPGQVWQTRSTSLGYQSINVLLVYPEFPKTFWSYEKILELVNRKALLPPLGLITVAAILPQKWNLKLADVNIRPVTEQEWMWADLVIMSGMIVQKDNIIRQINLARHHGKPVAVGGPYPSSTPEELVAAGADSLILDDGEINLPMFVAAWYGGDKGGRFSSEGVKPDVTSTPIPRHDLLEFKAYDSMSVPFSRGCRLQCEFCIFDVLHGRKPQAKAPE